MAEKATKDTKVQIELEYPLRSSKSILFSYISNPSGLQSWYADNVGVKGNKYSFKWKDGTEQVAEMIKQVTNKLIRFKIEGAAEEEYMEFKIDEDSITGDIELVITDFCVEEEAENVASLWDIAVENLKHIIGA